MDEKKRAIQLISAGAIEEYIKLAKLTSYRSGFNDGARTMLIFEGLIIGGALSTIGAGMLVRLIVKALKEDEDGSEELSEQLERIENTEK